MVPLTETFDSFSRLVRDLGEELNKQVQLKTYGSDIELDKQIIDELKDPLIHILRNAVDHGIESGEERRRNGKPVRGTVTVGAEYVGANVVIEVRDDGAGLDTAKVYRKAQERGLLSDEEERDGTMSEREILGLIFRPGFSTADTATAVSGRGVGMDVVKRNIERLHGSVEIDTQPGEGSTMRLTIPLTLSIIDGLLFSVGEGYYIVHLDAVEECFELDSSRYSDSSTREYVYIREQPISCIDLARIFDPRGKRPKIRQGIVVRGDREKVALLVDTIHRQYQTVIKPLSAALKDLQEVSGSTILGDGSIAFILDVKKLVETASTAATREERVG
jgi:two-component system chemotaxis sensor kinase CheA